MFALWLLETAVCFLVFRALSPGSAAVSPQGILPDLAGHPSSLALTLGMLGFATGLYRPETCGAIMRLLRQAVISAALVLPAVWLVGAIAGIDMAPPLGSRAIWLTKMVLAWVLLVLASRLLYMTALRLELFVRRVAVPGGAAAARARGALSSMRRGLFRVEIVPSVSGSPASSGPRLWAVVVADPADPAAATLPARVRRVEARRFWEDVLGRIDIGAAAPPDDAGGEVGPTSDRDVDRNAAVRRALDLALASLLLLFTSPIMLATALAIRLEDGGPVIYRQERVGLHGRIFTLWKFRSMRVDAEHQGPAWASPRDRRVTTVGGMIRRVRIDELPQLVNILRGEMTLVGPRPERPHFVEQLQAAIPRYCERTRVKPGLTGWAQVSLPYAASVDDARAKLSYDLYYVQHRSLLFDLMILLATFRVILFQEGAR